MGVEELEVRAHNQLDRDYGVVSADVKSSICALMESWRPALDEHCQEALGAFVAWIGALPPGYAPITVLATFGLGVGGRTWGEIIGEFDAYIGTDTFGLTAFHMFAFCEQRGRPHDHFERFFNLLIIDALASRMYSAAFELDLGEPPAKR
jgi:hypothetical protein